MMMFPHEALADDRIGKCSDEAQLYYPWLLAASNSFGRLNWNHGDLLTTAFAHLKSKPTAEQIRKCLEEYRENYLIFLYRTNEGETWGQWNIPARFLPRYKTADAQRSPPPPIKELAAFQASGIEARRKRNAISEDTIRVSDFENLPKSTSNSENLDNHCESLPHGTGGGSGVGKGSDKYPRNSPRKSQTHTRPKGPNATLGMWTQKKEAIAPEDETPPTDPIERKNALWPYRGIREKRPNDYARAPQWIKDELEEEEAHAKTESAEHASQ